MAYVLGAYGTHWRAKEALRKWVSKKATAAATWYTYYDLLERKVLNGVSAYEWRRWTWRRPSTILSRAQCLTDFGKLELTSVLYRQYRASTWTIPLMFNWIQCFAAATSQYFAD